MNSKELQGKLRNLEKLLDQHEKIGGVQQSDIIQLRKRVRQLRGDKQRLEAENKRLTSRINRLLKFGSE
jgi:hypothetical protein